MLVNIPSHTFWPRIQSHHGIKYQIYLNRFRNKRNTQKQILTQQIQFLKKSPLPCLSAFWLSEEGVEMSGLFAYKHCSRDCHRRCTWHRESRARDDFHVQIPSARAGHIIISSAPAVSLSHSPTFPGLCGQLCAPSSSTSIMYITFTCIQFAFFQSSSDVRGGILSTR